LKSEYNINNNEQLLITKYKGSGNQDLLAKLYEPYMDLVYGVCYKYLKESNLAQDAVVNIYLELVEKVKQYDIANFKSWLYTLAKNHCLMYLRKNKKVIVTEFNNDFVQSEVLQHLDEVKDKELAFDALTQCLKALADDQRQCVTLFYLENKGYKEIGNALSLDWNKVRSNIQNGRRNLKICMDAQGKNI
jgi:RNA polymerase sigma factor (sigma-70 family)